MNMNSTKNALRSICKLLFRKTSPVVCLSPLFINDSSQNDAEITEENKLKLPDVQTMTYSYLVKQSTLKSINNASELLTITFLAIETISEEYRKSLIKLINLYKESSDSDMVDLHEDTMVQIRAEIQNKKDMLMQLVSFMESVRKMADSTTEICYMYGMTNLCSSLSQRIDDAIKNMDKEIYNNQKLEKEFNYVQQEYIINADKH
ncbi:PREDICTED: uncharacterized protein LOC106788861 [Polistes canadensis]|uniref:uncharacterized protein LOC106788861 n=1 Tax=Polistes canadensis TaxID=91411 RepID=UPI000718EF33|nr:PREDICTED: uncharacterized protein LOC106788861 [Polistes canadensis]